MTSSCAIPCCVSMNWVEQEPALQPVLLISSPQVLTVPTWMLEFPFSSSFRAEGDCLGASYVSTLHLPSGDHGCLPSPGPLAQGQARNWDGLPKRCQGSRDREKCVLCPAHRSSILVVALSSFSRICSS